MANIKQCFTINQHRTTEEFNSYEELIKQGLFQGIEIFYPYDKTEEQWLIRIGDIELCKENKKHKRKCT